MEENLKKLEDILGIHYEDWKPETLLKVVENEDLRKLFSPELAKWLVENRKNDELVPIFMPLIKGEDFIRAQADSQSLINDYKNQNLTKEDYHKNIKERLKSENLNKRMFAYLCLISTDFEKEDIEEILDKEKMLSDISEYEAEILSFNVEEGAELMLQLLDILVYLREVYFQLFGEDVVPNNETLTDIFETIDIYAKKMLEIQKASGNAPKDAEVDIKMPELSKKDDEKGGENK